MHQHIKRELLTITAQPSWVLYPWLFYLIILCLFPLSLRPDVAFLPEIGSAVIWLAALLANLLSVERIFADDVCTGVIEQYCVSRRRLLPLVLSRVWVHWLCVNLPLILVVPVMASLFKVSASVWTVLMLTLILGTPVMSLLCALAGSILAGAQQKAVMASLLILPLMMPIVIFATSAPALAAMGMSVKGVLLLLGACLCLALSLLPGVISKLLRLVV